MPPPTATQNAAPESDLPNFCSAPAVLTVVIIAELFAITLTLASHGPRPGFLLALSITSLYMLWLGLVSATVLCGVRRWLTNLPPSKALWVCFALLQLTTLAVSLGGWWLNSRVPGVNLTSLNATEFLLRNLIVSSIVWAMVLRYFYVAGEWRRNVALEAQARIQALQARIRPHFLFNSMNTIAALTRRDPERAEEAIEDLADLFRATLGEAEQSIPLKEEFEVARIYQRMEQLRLGDRLQVEWQINDLPMRALIPGLTIQPLLENAIYHGIEPLADGGTVIIAGARVDDSRLRIVISNPVGASASNHRGNQVALENIRRRFALAFAGDAEVSVLHGKDKYEITLTFPAEGR